MAPRKNSRYIGCLGVIDDAGKTYLTERDPFRWDKDLQGTIRHVVGAGETLQSIAYRYYRSMEPTTESEELWGPEHLWWIIAEFQPVPILDPTLDLAQGTVLFIPSVRAVQAHLGGAS